MRLVQKQPDDDDDDASENFLRCFISTSHALKRSEAFIVTAVCFNSLFVVSGYGPFRILRAMNDPIYPDLFTGGFDGGLIAAISFEGSKNESKGAISHVDEGALVNAIPFTRMRLCIRRLMLRVSRRE